MPTPSSGRLAAANTGTIAMMLPPGIPGTANEANTTAKTTDTSCERRQRHAEQARQEHDADRLRDGGTKVKHRHRERENDPRRT